jgi:hypothetical protein
LGLKERKMTPAEEFARLNKIHWHERVEIPEHEKDGIKYTKHWTCSCRKDLLYFSNLGVHIEQSNPTFLDAKSILEVMMKRDDKEQFLAWIGMYGQGGFECPEASEWIEEYILNQDNKLLTEAIEWCRKEAGNERTDG